MLQQQRLASCGDITWQSVTFCIIIIIAVITVQLMAANVIKQDVTTLTVKRLASHDLTGSTLDRHLQSKERALVVEREIQNVTVAPGDRAVLNCRIQQLGTKTVTWRRQGDAHPLTIGLYPFAPDSRLSVDYNQRTNEWSLIIQDVTPEDEGLYHCQVTSKDDDNNMYNVHLYVAMVQVSGTNYVELGSPIRLICNATGRYQAPDDINWYQQGSAIQSNSRAGVVVSKKTTQRVLMSMLVIDSSQMEDAGAYSCQTSTGDAASIDVHILNDFLMNRRIDTRGVSSNGLLSDNTDDHKDEVALSSTLSVYQLHHHQAYVNTVSLVMKTAYCCILQSSIIYSGITFMTA